MFATWWDPQVFSYLLFAKNNPILDFLSIKIVIHSLHFFTSSHSFSFLCVSSFTIIGTASNIRCIGNPTGVSVGVVGPYVLVGVTLSSKRWLSLRSVRLLTSTVSGFPNISKRYSSSKRFMAWVARYKPPPETLAHSTYSMGPLASNVTLLIVIRSTYSSRVSLVRSVLPRGRYWNLRLRLCSKKKTINPSYMVTCNYRTIKLYQEVETRSACGVVRQSGESLADDTTIR